MATFEEAAATITNTDGILVRYTHISTGQVADVPLSEIMEAATKANLHLATIEELNQEIRRQSE